VSPPTTTRSCSPGSSPEVLKQKFARVQPASDAQAAMRWFGFVPQASRQSIGTVQRQMISPAIKAAGYSDTSLVRDHPGVRENPPCSPTSSTSINDTEIDFPAVA